MARERGNPDWLVVGIAVLVSGMWAASGAVGVVTHDYTGLTIMTPVMLIVVGAVVGRYGLNGRRQ